ncbi:uncharacterized protein B0H64DRAFT_438134 [Chaetomium fimeti]|uniref:Uncharacterized protein n=1 Tax=Chaetomium fimeti TaxID=1854472 RepID=A0AAE0LXC1_9PEZI|nr:hypothetical protein B0H64DRAFT_438134 [Chaetomium fimeti]
MRGRTTALWAIIAVLYFVLVFAAPASKTRGPVYANRVDTIIPSIALGRGRVYADDNRFVVRGLQQGFARDVGAAGVDIGTAISRNIIRGSNPAVPVAGNARSPACPACADADLLDGGGSGRPSNLGSGRVGIDPASGQAPPVIINHDEMFGGTVSITATEAEDGAGGLAVQHSTESGGIHITCKGISVCNPVTIINGNGGRRFKLSKLEKAEEKRRKKEAKEKGRWRFGSRFPSRFRYPCQCQHSDGDINNV